MTLSGPNPMAGSWPTKASAGGHELQPWEVNSSTRTGRRHGAAAPRAGDEHPAAAAANNSRDRVRMGTYRYVAWPIRLRRRDPAQLRVARAWARWSIGVRSNLSLPAA